MTEINKWRVGRELFHDEDSAVGFALDCAMECPGESFAVECFVEGEWREFVTARFSWAVPQVDAIYN